VEVERGGVGERRPGAFLEGVGVEHEQPRPVGAGVSPTAYEAPLSTIRGSLEEAGRDPAAFDPRSTSTS
jgi:hypothetical protein